MYGWETEEEEDVWEVELDFISPDPDECDAPAVESDMTVGELMEWRYIRAEREKEQVSLSPSFCHWPDAHMCRLLLIISQGNTAFKQGNYHEAIKRYRLAHQIEPEMPHYNLNLAAAYLKIDQYVQRTVFYAHCQLTLDTTRWVKAEKVCDDALGQHKSIKGYWRRAQARKAQNRTPDAVKGM